MNNSILRLALAAIAALIIIKYLAPMLPAPFGLIVIIATVALVIVWLWQNYLS